MQNGIEKRSMIINAAETLFERYGYQKTSLDDIAREAQLGKGTIYYYFESKEDIFFEVVKEHAERFYKILKTELNKHPNFEDRFSNAILLPIKLVYEHAATLLEAVKNLPNSYLQKLGSFRQENKQRIMDLLSEVIEYGISQGEVSITIPVDKLVNIIFDWFLLGDANIIIKYPEEFIKKAETDYDLIIQIMLKGILKRGSNT